MYKIVLMLLISADKILCANILYVSSIPSPSHHIWNRLLAIELANKGHNVTLVDPDEDNALKPTNYSHILLEGIYEALGKDFDVNAMVTLTPIQLLYAYLDWCIFSCKHALQSEGLQKLLNYRPDFKFDLIIVDVTTGSCLYPVIHRFNYPPAIGATPFLLPSYVSYSFGNHFHPTYNPWYALPYTTNMNFIERVWNFLFTHFDVALRYIRQYKEEHKAAKEIFGTNLPPMEDLERHISLVLTNIDPVLDHPHFL